MTLFFPSLCSSLTDPPLSPAGQFRPGHMTTSSGPRGHGVAMRGGGGYLSGTDSPVLPSR